MEMNESTKISMVVYTYTNLISFGLTVKKNTLL